MYNTYINEDVHNSFQHHHVLQVYVIPTLQMCSLVNKQTVVKYIYKLAFHMVFCHQNTLHMPNSSQPYFACTQLNRYMLNIVGSKHNQMILIIVPLVTGSWGLWCPKETTPVSAIMLRRTEAKSEEVMNSQRNLLHSTDLFNLAAALPLRHIKTLKPLLPILNIAQSLKHGEVRCFIIRYDRGTIVLYVSYTWQYYFAIKWKQLSLACD